MTFVQQIMVTFDGLARQIPTPQSGGVFIGCSEYFSPEIRFNISVAES
jgi:hypothetical protein